MPGVLMSGNPYLRVEGRQVGRLQVLGSQAQQGGQEGGHKHACVCWPIQRGRLAILRWPKVCLALFCYECAVRLCSRCAAMSARCPHARILTTSGAEMCAEEVKGQHSPWAGSAGKVLKPMVDGLT